jgi:glycine/D-amino acid oxidase-like deaminating enzyme
MAAMGLRSTADAVVIGGGIVGVSAAAFLAEAGPRVVLVERAEIAAGASGRNSGVVQHPFDPVLVDLHLETLDLYRNLEGLRIGGRPAGLLNVTRDVDGVRRLTASLRAAYPHLDPTFLDPEAVHRLEPSIAVGVAACRLDIGYPVEPIAATEAYAALARRRGVEIRVGSEAAVWRSDGRVAGVRLQDGAVVAAPDVVVAAGPWSPAVIDPGGAWRPIRPIWGVVVPATLAEPPRHVLEEAEISIEPGAKADDGGIAFSLVTADDASSLGSTFLAEEPDVDELVPVLIRRGAGFVPEIAHAPVGSPRLCARPQSADGRPLIGRVPGTDGLWIAAGHGPWGISTGPASGRLIAALVAGRQERPPATLDPGRFGVPPT